MPIYCNDLVARTRADARAWRSEMETIGEASIYADQLDELADEIERLRALLVQRANESTREILDLRAMVAKLEQEVVKG